MFLQAVSWLEYKTTKIYKNDNTKVYKVNVIHKCHISIRQKTRSIQWERTIITIYTISAQSACNLSSQFDIFYVLHNPALSDIVCKNIQTFHEWLVHTVTKIFRASKIREGYPRFATTCTYTCKHYLNELLLLLVMNSSIHAGSLSYCYHNEGCYTYMNLRRHLAFFITVRSIQHPYYSRLCFL